MVVQSLAGSLGRLGCCQPCLQVVPAKQIHAGHNCCYAKRLNDTLIPTCRRATTICSRSSSSAALTPCRQAARPASRRAHSPLARPAAEAPSLH